MDEVTYGLATFENTQEIASRLDTADALEAWCATGRISLDAIRYSVQHSNESRVASIDDVPLGIFGVMRAPTTKGLGLPWFMATREARHHPLTMTRSARFMIDAWMEDYDLLANMVSDANVRSIEWLETLGFTIEEPVAYGPFGRPFRPFYMHATGVTLH